MSQLLKGLKLFPMDVTAVVSVSDNGRSTGLLRKDFNIPAVGDITKVMLSMSEASSDIISLANYKFKESSSIYSHSIKNLLLTALLEQKGNFKEALPILTELLQVKGKVLPLTEESVDLVGITSDKKEIVGEEDITFCKETIIDVKYDRDFVVNEDVINAIKEADLVVLSSGSLLTSIFPHIICKKIVDTIKEKQKEVLYVCNLVTQPGETTGFKVSDHVKLLQKHLGKDGVNIVVANNGKIDDELALKYSSKEQKDPVELDEDVLNDMNVKIIKDNLVTIEDNLIRHDALKVGYHIFSYLMDKENN